MHSGAEHHRGNGVADQHAGEDKAGGEGGQEVQAQGVGGCDGEISAGGKISYQILYVTKETRQLVARRHLASDAGVTTGSGWSARCATLQPVHGIAGLRRITSHGAGIGTSTYIMIIMNCLYRH